jgi:hypothetical protein
LDGATTGVLPDQASLDSYSSGTILSPAPTWRATGAAFEILPVANLSASQPT